MPYAVPSVPPLSNVGRQNKRAARVAKRGGGWQRGIVEKANLSEMIPTLEKGVARGGF